MREFFGPFVCVWFVLHCSCLGRLVVEKNNLKVISPDSLKDVYESAIGNFGVPQYGGTLIGSVFYTKSRQKACTSFEDAGISLKNKPGGIPIFLLADRGGVDVKKIDECIGDIEADVDNLILQAEQEAQIGKGSRGDVTILPTLVVNSRQYRGKLDKGAVLKAICSGFEETTEPVICLTKDMETNECLENNGGCWEDKAANITACRDTFRGRVCECPIVQGVKFVGDGYTHCEASGLLRCEINNGRCWKGSKGGRTYSACVEDHTKGCQCPPGFRGDGINSCEDNDECKEKVVCQCAECKCTNTWGSYECSCGGKSFYIHEHDTCISEVDTSEVGLGFMWFVMMVLAVAGVGGYALYKYRIRRYMDPEIRAIMAQYIPLDNRGNKKNAHIESDTL